MGSSTYTLELTIVDQAEFPDEDVPVVGLTGGSRSYAGPVGDWVKASERRPIRTQRGNPIPFQPSLNGANIWPNAPARDWWVRTDHGSTTLYERVPGVAKRGGLLTGVARKHHWNNVPSKTYKDLLKLDLFGAPGVSGSSYMTMYTALRFHPNGATGKGPLAFNLDHTGCFWQIERDLSMAQVFGRCSIDPMARKEYLEMSVSGNLESSYQWVGDWSQYPGKPKLTMDFAFGDFHIVEHQTLFWFTDTQNHTIVKVDRSPGGADKNDPRNWRPTVLAGEFGNPNYNPAGWPVPFGFPTSIDYHHPSGKFYLATGGDVETDGNAALPRTHGAVWEMTQAGQLTFLFKLDAAVCVRWSPADGGGLAVTDANAKLWFYSFATKALTLLRDNAAMTPPRSSGFPLGWHWIDVDRFGTCSPVGTIVETIGATVDGVTLFMPRGDGTYDTSEGVKGGQSSLPSCGPRGQVHEGGTGHYPYTMSFSDEEAIMMGTGFGTNMLNVIIKDQGAWQNYGATLTDPTLRDARAIHRRGSVIGFAGRPPFSALLVERGYGDTGVPLFDDVAAMSAAEQAAHVQGGMGGSVPRPEIRGYPLAEYLAWVHVNSYKGQEGVAVAKPAKPQGLAPGVTGLTLSSSEVTFTTSAPTLCQVRFGDARGLWRYTEIESVDASQHRFSLRHVPQAAHVAVVCQTADGLTWQTPTFAAPSNITTTTSEAVAFQDVQLNVFGPLAVRPNIVRDGDVFSLSTLRYSGNSRQSGAAAGLKVIYLIDGVEVTGPVDANVIHKATIANVPQRWHWASVIIVDADAPTNYIPEAVLFNVTTQMDW
jgi:hypothetical protein